MKSVEKAEKRLESTSVEVKLEASEDKEIHFI